MAVEEERESYTYLPSQCEQDEAERRRQDLRRKPQPTVFTSDVSGLEGAPILNCEIGFLEFLTANCLVKFIEDESQS